MPAIDINRGTTGINLPLEVSNEIWTRTQEESAIMRLATPIDMPGSGIEVDIITGDPTAAWVGETEETPVSKGSASSKKIKPYNMSLIVPFSLQFARDKARLYDEMVARFPGALAMLFDGTIVGKNTKPGEMFDQLNDVTGVDVKTDPWTGFVAADAAVAANNAVVTGHAIAPQLRSILLTAKDGNDRPLFVDSIAASGVGTIIGNPVYLNRNLYVAGTAPTSSGGADGVAETLGITGDWTSARYGAVQGMTASVTTDATITGSDGKPINLWQRGMFAIKLDLEVGFGVKDKNDFVRLTGDTPAYVGD